MTFTAGANQTYYIQVGSALRATRHDLRLDRARNWRAFGHAGAVPECPAAAAKPPVSGRAVKRVKGKYVIKVKGTFKLPSGFTKAQACNGLMFITVKRGKTLITARTTKVDGKCRYAKTIKLARSKLKRAKFLTLTVRFGGNAYLAATGRNYKLKIKR